MKKFKNIRKILWAVDPFQKQSSQIKTMAALVGDYARSTHASVEIVYAYTQPQIPMRPKALSELERPFLQLTEDRLKKIARLIKVPCKVHIATHHAHKIYVPAATLLLDYARKTGVDVVAVASHGRSGFKRLFLGSFAEDLLLGGTLPVFIAGSHVKPKQGHHLSRVLLPVDFTPASRKLFQWCLTYVKTEKAKLTLFHGIVDPFFPLIQPAAMALGGSYPIDAATYAEGLAQQRAELQKWVATARQSGVECKSIISGDGGPLYEAICDAAEKQKQDLIVIGTHHGALSSVLVGSVTRQVVRHATVPVLAMKL
jgi:nucleotide-binding universal stress UspA family protein